MTDQKILLCEVRDGRISELTICCSGGWDEELRSRLAAETTIRRPCAGGAPTRTRGSDAASWACVQDADPSADVVSAGSLDRTTMGEMAALVGLSPAHAPGAASRALTAAAPRG